MVAFNQIDFPQIRKALACPICHRPKDAGAVTCWPCYRAFDGRGGYLFGVRTNLEGLEGYLAKCDEEAIRRTPRVDPDVARAELKALRRKP